MNEAVHEIVLALQDSEVQKAILGSKLFQLAIATSSSFEAVYPPLLCSEVMDKVSSYLLEWIRVNKAIVADLRPDISWLVPRGLIFNTPAAAIMCEIKWITAFESGDPELGYVRTPKQGDKLWDSMERIRQDIFKLVIIETICQEGQRHIRLPDAEERVYGQIIVGVCHPRFSTDVGMVLKKYRNLFISGIKGTFKMQVSACRALNIKTGSIRVNVGLKQATDINSLSSGQYIHWPTQARVDYKGMGTAFSFGTWIHFPQLKKPTYSQRIIYG